MNKLLTVVFGDEKVRRVIRREGAFGAAAQLLASICGESGEEGGNKLFFKECKEKAGNFS
ncbi:MAG: hypothetical protein ACM3WV_04175 [Bacillota bacterium]